MLDLLLVYFLSFTVVVAFLANSILTFCQGNPGRFGCPASSQMLVLPESTAWVLTMMSSPYIGYAVSAVTHPQFVLAMFYIGYLSLFAWFTSLL